MGNNPHLTGFSGLHVTENQASSLPAGGLLTATNVAANRPGILESRPGFFPVAWSNAVTSGTSKTLLSLATSAPSTTSAAAMFYGLSFSDDVCWANGSDTQKLTGTSSLFSSNNFTTCSTGRYTQNKAILPNTLQGGPFVIPSTEGPTDNKTGRRSGIPRALGPIFDGTTTKVAKLLSGSGPFAASQKAQYKWVMAIRSTTGQIIRGAPTLYSVTAQNGGGGSPCEFSFRILVPRELGQLAADGFDVVIETYRTAIVNSADTIVPRFFLALTTPVSSSIAASDYHQNTGADNTSNDRLGEELYTDQEIEGPLQENDRPPASYLVEQYNGFVAYANTISKTTAKVLAPGAGGLVTGDTYNLNGSTYTVGATTTSNYATKTIRTAAGATDEQLWIGEINAINDMTVNDATITPYGDLLNYVYPTPAIGTTLAGDTGTYQGYDNSAAVYLNNGTTAVISQTLGEAIPGQIAISKDGFADAVPPLNAVTVGDPYQAINAMIWLRGGLFVMKPDGAFYVSGSFFDGGGNDFSVSVVDRAYHLNTLAQFAQFGNTGYGACDEGLIKFTEGAISLMDAALFSNSAYDYRVPFKQVMVHPNRREVYFFPTDTAFTDGATDPLSPLNGGFLVYGILTDTFTAWHYSGTTLDNFVQPIVSGGLSRAYQGAAASAPQNTFTTFCYRMTTLATPFPVPTVAALISDLQGSTSQFYSTGFSADFGLTTTGTVISGGQITLSTAGGLIPHGALRIGSTLVAGSSPTQGCAYVTAVSGATATVSNVDNAGQFLNGGAVNIYYPAPMTLRVAALGADSAANEKVWDEVVWGTRSSNLKSITWAVGGSNYPVGQADTTIAGDYPTQQRQPIYRVGIPLDARESNELYVGLVTSGDGRDQLVLESVEATVTGQGVRGQQ